MARAHRAFGNAPLTYRPAGEAWHVSTTTVTARNGMVFVLMLILQLLVAFVVVMLVVVAVVLVVVAGWLLPSGWWLF